MYIPISYDQDFDDLWMHLKSKFPEKLFDIDGLGKQIDMMNFTNEFFSEDTTCVADVSIDANANVDDNTVISYNHELPKPFMKLNSYYMLWKEIKRLYDRVTADEIIEKQVAGDIYINDVHGIASGMPYSYYGKNSLIVKIKNDIVFTTMEDLYNILEQQYTTEIIDKNATQINLQDVFVLDDNNDWVNVSRILKHKSHTNLIGIETKNGYCTLVTSDHPVILDNGECYANELKKNSKIKISNSKAPILETKDVDVDYAYFVGFHIGDGHTNLCDFTIYQKDIINSKIYQIANKLFDNVKLCKDERRLEFGHKKDVPNMVDTGLNSIDRKLPNDILTWNKQAIKSLIAGIIDSDGNINSQNGICSIRVISYALVNQLGEIFRALNLGDVRVSFCGKYHSVNGFASDNDIYRISCRLKDKDIANYSVKVKENADIIYKEMKKDGRWESNEVYKVFDWETPEYVYDITTDSGHFHCGGMIQHNCFNYSTYDIMTKGLPMIKKIKSIQPKYLYSFKSQVEQFTIIAANSTLGATGLADFLLVMSYYVEKMLATKTDAHFKFETEDDCWKYLEENLRSFIYTINQPTRANQSCFTNLSIYDDYFLEDLKKSYIFEDGSTLNVEIVKKMQDMFLRIMCDEMHRTPITFPVLTACFSVDEENNIKDEEFAKMIAHYNKDYGNINLYCGSSSTLSSCCRLRSDRSSEYFNSFGAGSTKIGSLGVCTINLPRLAFKNKYNIDRFIEDLKDMVKICSQVNNAKRKIVERRIGGHHPLYEMGFMDISKQYSTVGINGFNEAIEILGENILDEKGQELGIKIIDTINAENDKYSKQYNAPHNCEQIPGESVSVKLAAKDRLLKYNKEYEMYSNQFIPLTTNADMLDRIKLQGIFDKKFTGGAICHINIETEIEDEQKIVDLIKYCAKQGVVYWAINYNLQECENSHLTVGKRENCSICGKPIINNYTRVVGFLTNTKNWNPTRRKIDYPNRVFYKDI